jgi:dipeptide transport system substrate-binding protein
MPLNTPFAGLLLALLCGTSLAASTLKYCSEASPATFDPAQTNSITDFDASAHNVFNQLVQTERGTLTLIPALAERWEVSADGLTYTFSLRRGVQFHSTAWFKPGRAFNADDVLFTFQRLLDANHPFRKAYPTESPYVADYGLDKAITAVEKLDEFTVRFRLAKPMATFLLNLYSEFASIHSAEYAEQLLKTGTPEKIATQPIGTGPFMFRSYQKDVAIRYAAHANYWNKEDARVDNLIFVITPDKSVRVQKLRSGECDIAAYPSPQDLVELKKEPAFKIAAQTGNNVGYLAYNTQRSPFDKLDVRRALDMAINRQNILDTIYQGDAVLSQTPVPPATWGHDATLKGAAYDPANARTLLDKAGVKDLKMEIWALPVQRAYNPNGRLMAEMIQSDWAKIGVKASIVTMEWAEYLRRVKRGDHDAAMFGWTASGDPDRFLSLLACAGIDGNNIARWCHPEYDGLVTKARQLTGEAQRAPLYKKAQTLFRQNLPWTPLAHGMLQVPVRRNVQGFKTSPDGNMYFYGVTID